MAYVIDVTGNLKIEERTREMCRLPYPGHPKGCPNYGKVARCPPEAPMVGSFIDLDEQHWIVIQEFNLAAWVTLMQDKHPAWTDAQLRNPRLWQSGVKRRLREGVEEFINGRRELVYTLVPEAMGVNVFRTLIPLGVAIKARPKRMIYKVALVGYDVKEVGLGVWV